MNTLASIQVISEINPASNADSLELAIIQGWQSVVKKGDFKVGDKIVFVSIDSLMPPASYNKFLWNKNRPDEMIRVKTIRLRGNVSQGIVFKMDDLTPDAIQNPEKYEVGMDVTELLGIQKYEREIHGSMNANAVGTFATDLISITDEDNLQSNLRVLEELAERDVVLSLKIDGMSFTALYDGKFRIFSRRLELNPEDDSVYSRMAKKYDLQNKLSCMPYKCAIQAEICGPKIQDNPLSLKEEEMFIFNIKLLEREMLGSYYGHQSMIDFCDVRSLPMVPTIKIIEKFDLTLPQLQELANNAKYDNGAEAEGIVIRPLIYQYSRVLRKMLSVKVLNQNYKHN